VKYQIATDFNTHNNPLISAILKIFNENQLEEPTALSLRDRALHIFVSFCLLMFASTPLSSTFAFAFEQKAAAAAATTTNDDNN